MRPGDIDVLVFASNGRVEGELALQLRKHLVDAGYRKVLIVTEEEWERRETTFSQSGMRIDMKRYLRGDPRPFRHERFEFDDEALEDAICSSRIVLFVNPSYASSRLPEPFEAGIELIRRSRSIRHAHEELLSRYICCYASDSPKHRLLEDISLDLEVTMLHDVTSLERNSSYIEVNAFLLAFGVGMELLDQLRLYKRRTSQQRVSIVLGNLADDAERLHRLIDTNKDIIEKVRRIDAEVASAIESCIS